MITTIIIILLLIIIIYKKNIVSKFVNIKNKSCTDLKIYHLNWSDNKIKEVTNKSYNISRPNVLLVAGTHGNEPAGSVSLNNIIKKNNIKLKKGSITFISEVNPCGLRNNIRDTYNFGIGKFGGDINRTYPIKEGGKIKSKQAEIVINYVKKADYILDFHEGYSWYKIDKNSVGSTLTPSGFKNINKISEVIINKLNKNITDENKEWMIRYDKSCDIYHTLNCYSYNIRKPYILIETAGQDDVQPLDIRVNQNYTIINGLLEELQMV